MLSFLATPQQRKSHLVLKWLNFSLLKTAVVAILNLIQNLVKIVFAAPALIQTDHSTFFPVCYQSDDRLLHAQKQLQYHAYKHTVT